MTSPLTFRKAERTSVKLKIGLQGPSGSGKTLGALALARSIAPTGRIAVIDSENGSASFYADKYEFETLNLDPPYTSKRYVDSIKAAVDAGFDILVIDSISHQWAGTGGILERKDEADRVPGSNHFTNWGPFTKEHELFKSRILEAPIHIIATLRTKQEYALTSNERGKATPTKLGMAPIQREAFEYEFGVVFELQMDHQAKVSKDRTFLFDDTKLFNLVGDGIGKTLVAWLASAKPAPEPPPSSSKPAAQEAALTVDSAKALSLPGPKGAWGGRAGEPLGSLSPAALNTVEDWMLAQLASQENDEFSRVVSAIGLIRTDRAREEMAKTPGLDALAGTALDPVTSTSGEVADAIEKRETVAAGVGDKGDGLPF